MWHGPTGDLTYSGLKVVELAQQPQGEILGKLLADQGADVVKVEPPGGVRSRHVGPFVEGHDGDPDQSLTFWTYNTGKRSVVIDVATDRGSAQRAALIADADVLITSGTPAELAARITEECFDYLHDPVMRIAGEDIPISVSPLLESHSVPSPASIAGAVRRMF